MSRLPRDSTYHPKYSSNNIYTKYDLENIIPTKTPLCPHWSFSMHIDLDLHQFPKKSTCPNTFKNLFKEKLSLSHTQTQIYTNASLSEGRVGKAIIYDNNQIQWRLSEKCSIYTAEALAIFIAIKYTISEINNNNITIYSDLLSTLTSLKNVQNPTEVVRKIHNAHYKAHLSGKNISYSWIPGHCCIDGNERADKAAKQAHTNTNIPYSYLLSYSDIKKVIERDTCQQWETQWNNMTTKLNEIKRSILPWTFPVNTPRKYETAINRLRIGHTRLTHAHLMKKEDPSICICCGVPLTVKHIITECNAHNMERIKQQISYHLVESLSPKPDNIVKLCQFLTNTHLINFL
jgi:ribonuclease HI